MVSVYTVLNYTFTFMHLVLKYICKLVFIHAVLKYICKIAFVYTLY